MLEACKAIRPHDYERWQRLLTGLWFLGIRISEALGGSLEASDAGFGIDLGGLYPAFRIFGEAQKTGRDQICPIAPDGASSFCRLPKISDEALFLISPAQILLQERICLTSALLGSSQNWTSGGGGC